MPFPTKYVNAMGQDAQKAGKAPSSGSGPPSLWQRLRYTPARGTLTKALQGPRFPALPPPSATQLPEPMITPPAPPMLEPIAEAPTSTMEFQVPGMMASGLGKQQFPPTFHVSKSMTPLPQPSLQPVEHYPSDGFRFMPDRPPAPPPPEPKRKLVASGGMSKQRKKS